MTPYHAADGITLWHGDALKLSKFIEPESVDLLITSPPYWSLRSYQDGGEHYDGQIGSEESPSAFIDALVACTADWVKVLKPSGSMFVNLGDKYAVSGGQQASDGIPAKSLMGLPWRYAIRCIDQLGLILRAEICWSKPNNLPESVQDRVRRSHEQWFHLTRQGRYFAAVDEVREPGDAGNTATSRSEFTHHRSGDTHRALRRDPEMFNPLGKLPGSVWSIPSEPLQVPDHVGVDHFAAFPTEWPRRLILGWSPTGICLECGEGRRPVVDVERDLSKSVGPSMVYGAGRHGQNGSTLRSTAEASITGYACACPTPDAPTRPAVICDPFGGTGTVAAVARALGRHAHHVDLSRDYLRLAQWRIWDEPTHRKIRDRTGLRTPQPPAIEGQVSLFGDVA